jgi:alpha-mannosidase
LRKWIEVPKALDGYGNWPQIYKKAGIDYFVTQKMSWNETNQLPLKLFWWESPDGSNRFH